MTFPLSEFAGTIAGMLLAIPPVKDQYYRYREYRDRRRGELNRWPQLATLRAEIWGAKRQEYDGWDSLILAAGAAALIASFIVKALYG